MGLTVLLNLSSNDYYYPMRNYVGATAMIFDSNDFPESSTGELQVKLMFIQKLVVKYSRCSLVF
jgi:hypothetical protein